MNWVDGVIIILLIFFTLEGLGRSFISESLDFLSFLLAFFLSLRFYNLASGFYQTNFQIPHSLSNVLGFMTLWFLIETVFFGLIHALFAKYLYHPAIDKPLRPYAVIPAFLRGLVFIAIILVLVGSFPIQPKIKLAVQNSVIGSRILDNTHRLEAPLKNVFGGITQDTLSFLTIKPKSDERVDLGFQTTEFKPNSQLEERMIVLVNQERTSRGLKALTFDSKLRDVGRAHSADMFTRGYFSHYSPENKNVADRAEEIGVKYLVVGENLALAPDLNLAHNGLMNSPGHRANILSPEFGKIGIGIMDGGVYGIMVTQVFTN